MERDGPGLEDRFGGGMKLSARWLANVPSLGSSFGGAANWACSQGLKEREYIQWLGLLVG